MNVFKQLRKDASFTQKSLADKIHVNQATISKWEKNKSVSDISMLPVLSKLFG